MNGQSIKYISLFEATKLTNYSQEYISLLCRQKKMEGTKIGRNWVTTKEWVESYINKTKGNGQNIIPVKIEQKIGAEKEAPSVFSPQFFSAKQASSRRETEEDRNDLEDNKKNNLSLRDNYSKDFQPTQSSFAGSDRHAVITVPPFMGKLILTAIICSLLASGFIFLQLGQKRAIETNLTAINEASANISEGNSFIFNYTEKAKKEITGFAIDKITVADNFFNYIKSKAIFSLSNTNSQKSNPRVAGVEDSDEGRGSISNEDNNSASEEKKGIVIIPLEGDKNSPENIDMINRISASFSDDVNIRPNEDGASGIINPKNNPEENYLYLMVPVKE